ncbi:TraR/DksA C4-type zinc finger protein [Patescibacteria group bacterium]|nr:TraR/DksA C4-type zinc finger protein [Patescibacteria group bacterium]MBU4481215.1 TraR/DksA C4-type zinc finger protein [Patescibacteria group bacterium]
MGKKFLFQLRENLKKEKGELEEELKRFAKKDEKLEGNWETRFPYFGEESGGGILEKAADEVEKYSALLPIEYSLELKLREINLALKRIKKGKYGICEKCRKPIEAERLRAFPEAKICSKCLKPR